MNLLKNLLKWNISAGEIHFNNSSSFTSTSKDIVNGWFEVRVSHSIQIVKKAEENRLSSFIAASSPVFNWWQLTIALIPADWTHFVCHSIPVCLGLSILPVLLRLNRLQYEWDISMIRRRFSYDGLESASRFPEMIITKKFNPEEMTDGGKISHIR